MLRFPPKNREWDTVWEDVMAMDYLRGMLILLAIYGALAMGTAITAVI